MKDIPLDNLPGESFGDVRVSCGLGTELAYSGEALQLFGANRNKDVGLRIHVPADASLYLPEVLFENCFINLWKTGNGYLKVDGSSSCEFGGDNANLRGSNVYIGETLVRDNTPTRPYNLLIRKGNESIEDCLTRNGEVVYDASLLKFEPHPKWPNYECIVGYHVDGVVQIYSFKPDGKTPDFDGVISNIKMPRIDAELSGAKTQAVMASERCLCDDIEIGTEKYKVLLDGYPYHTVINSLSNSKIGCVGAELDGQLRIENVKHSKHKSHGNQVVGISAEDVVDDEGSVEFVESFEVATERKEVETMSSNNESDAEHDVAEGSAMTSGQYSIANEFTEIPAKSLEQYAAEDNLDVCLFDAIINKESLGKCFYKGRVLKLFERHVNDRSLRKHGIDPAEVIRQDPSAQDIIGYSPYRTYGNYALQQSRFDKAFDIHPDAAIEACSWGFAQVLGENWKHCGFKSANDFRTAMQTKEGQLFAFIQYLRNTPGLIDALRAKDWAEVKRLYNGPRKTDKNGDGVDDYTADLAKEYARAVLRRAPKKGIKKSRTMINNAVAAVSKVAVGGGIALNADSFSGLVGQITKGREQVEQVKDAVNETRESVGEVIESVAVIGDQLVFANDALAGLWYLPWALCALLVLALIPHARMLYTYMQDHGYLKGGSDVF